MVKIIANNYANFIGHNSSIYALAENPENCMFFSASGDGLVVKWDLSIPGDDGVGIAKVDSSIYAMHYLQQSGILAIGQNNFGIHMVDPESKTVVSSIPLTKSSIFDIKSIDNKLFVGTGARLRVIRVRF